MTFRKIILFLLISLSLVANVQARMPTERSASTSASIFELPPFERAVCCIRFYEGMHRAKDYPYVGYGHKLRPGERYSANMSTYEAEQLLRKDLRELCAMFRSYGRDSLLLAALSYNIGPYKVTGYKGIPIGCHINQCLTHHFTVVISIGVCEHPVCLLIDKAAHLKKCVD